MIKLILRAQISKIKSKQITLAVPRTLPLLPQIVTTVPLPKKKFAHFQKIFLDQNQKLVTILTRKIQKPDSDNPIEDYYSIGTICQANLTDEGDLKVKGIQRVKVNRIIRQTLATTPQESYKERKNYGPWGIDQLLTAQVERVNYQQAKMDVSKENKLKFIAKIFQSFDKQSQFRTLNRYNPYNPHGFLDQILQHLSVVPFLKANLVQQAFQALEFQERCQKIQKLIYSMKEYAKHLSQIQQQANKRLRDKKYQQFYTELLKLAKQKAQGKRGKQLFVQNQTKKLMSHMPPLHVQQVFAGQIQKYLQSDQQSMQFQISKSYIEWIADIPYGNNSQEIFDVQKAKAVLDSQHFGMEQPKNKILQYIAVGSLKNSLKGKVLCFIGPPGVGKTTFAASIAKALGRKFVSVSLGGVTDSSALKGHRRTYIGAYPGKIVAALKQSQTNNPVILLDEIDKMGRSSQGDPRSQLLQILDPSQNSSFIDNFMQYAIDLSSVIFICSANNLGYISKPLQDRMQKIYLSSYTNDQKIGIFNMHIHKKVVDKIGLTENQYNLQPSAVKAIIQKYTRGQPGVRQLQLQARKLFEKVNFRIVQSAQQGKQHDKIQIHQDNLEQFLGPAKFNPRDRIKRKGVAYVLAETQYGGKLCAIQAVKRSSIGSSAVASTRGLLTTGSLGQVIKQSINIAYMFIRNYAFASSNNQYLFNNQVHVHIPDGAVKKDGAQASLAVAVSLLSLSMGKQVRLDIGMAGQLTLKGQLLPTKRIKQKILLAKRQKLSQIIIPQSNRGQVMSLPKNVCEDVNIRFASKFEQVAAILFE